MHTLSLWSRNCTISNHFLVWPRTSAVERGESCRVHYQISGAWLGFLAQAIDPPSSIPPDCRVGITLSGKDEALTCIALRWRCGNGQGAGAGCRVQLEAKFLVRVPLRPTIHESSIHP